MRSMRKVIFFCLFCSNLWSNGQILCEQYTSLNEQVLKSLIQYFQRYDYPELKSLNGRIILCYLQKKFKLSLQLPAHFLDIPRTYEEDKHAHYYFILVKPKYTPRKKQLLQDYAQTHDIEHLLLFSLYPETLSFDEECKNTILQPLGYDSFSMRAICHFSLAYYWLKQNKNVRRLEHILKIFESHFEEWKLYLIEGLKYEKGYTDTGIEGLLAFIFMDKWNEIPLKSLEEFWFYTSNDGGYPWDLDSTSSNFHASLIALWLVCELERYCK